MATARRFENRTALVTGAGSGIGRAAALRLAEEGAAVAALDRTPDTVEETARSIQTARGRAVALTCDVSVSEEVEGAVRAAVAEFGPIDVGLR